MLDPRDRGRTELWSLLCGEDSDLVMAMPHQVSRKKKSGAVEQSFGTESVRRGWYEFGRPSAENITTDPAADKQRLETVFVGAFLQHQQDGGSIDFGNWSKASEVLCEAIISGLKDFMTSWQRLSLDNLARKVVWTATVHVLLKRDLQSRKALWALMAIKTASYVRMRWNQTAAGPDLLKLMRWRFGSIKLPVHQDPEGCGKSQQEDRVVLGAGESSTLPVKELLNG
ncbi:hypothetical protein VTI74DRAFT_6709 [Chaetomium olivicolor]